jgi:O-antigen ligase
MKKVSQLNTSTEVSPVRWILGGLAAITLYFQTNLSDPFNSPKQWILLITAAWLVGYIISFRKTIFLNNSIKVTFQIVMIFILVALIVTVFTDFKYIAIFGDTQRRNGFISYISLGVYLLASSVFFRLFNIKRLYLVTLIIATVTAVYAFLQTTGKDFVQWNNPYNSIIGTLGNPNFAAAVMAVMGVLLFAVIFINEFAIHYRIFSSVVAILLFWLIYKSNARQGLLSYILGVGLFLVIWLLGKHRKLGMLTASGGLIVFIFAVLGILQTGPLEKYLYKPSVSVRGYYWRAGIEMVKDHPFVGIGMDRYGAYFKQYREVGYPLSYGFDITSSNAHNTFIQFFATGGIVLGLSYLILNAYILKCAILGIKNLTGNNRLLLAGVFSAWIAFQAQSLVSIDNIGISIWGWILGGSIIGLFVSSNSSLIEDSKQFIGRRSDINLERALISFCVSIPAIVLVSMLYRGEVNTYNSRGNFNLQDQTIRTVFKDLQAKVINTPLIDPSYSLSSAMYLVQAGFTEQGLFETKKIHQNDPRNLDAINGLALTYEQLNNITEAISYRLKMANLDQWNAVNYLELGKDYKAKGDEIKSKIMLEKILSFAQNDPIAAKARAELTQ